MIKRIFFQSQSEFSSGKVLEFFRVCFVVFMRRIAGYLMSEEGKQTGTKCTDDLIVFLLEKLDSLQNKNGVERLHI